jgi:hypothetical protein
MNRARLFGVASIAAAGLFAQGSAIAEYVDGNNLLEQCRSKAQLGQAFCRGYILAIADSKLESNATRNICVPRSVTVDQLRDIVVKYLEQNARYGHLPANFLVHNSLWEVFSCSKL